MSQYRTGTVNVTNGSPNLVGVGTNWLGNVAAGNLFTVSGSLVPYIAGANPTDDTHIALSSNYAGATQNGLAYSFTTSLTPNRSLPYMEDRDIDTATIFKSAMVKLDTILGAVFTANRGIATDANGNLISTSSLVLSGGALTSVVTPLVKSADGVPDIVVQVGTAFGWGFTVTGNTAFYPVSADAGSDIGKATNRIRSVFSTIIDSGTTGSLSLRTNNGSTQVQVLNQAAGVAANSVQLAGGVAGTSVLVAADGSDTNIDLRFGTKGSGSHNFFTGTTISGGILSAGVLQFQILHTASATRNITGTGSNGGNPTISTTAGGLDFSSATIRFPSIGTTANAANATLNAVGSNDLLRSTSSAIFKKILGRLELAEAKRIVLGSKAVRFESLASADYAGEEHLGFVAEQIAEIDERLVTRDMRGRPDWVQYPLYVVPLAVLAADHERRLAALEARSRK
jgi:hypothetical protein